MVALRRFLLRALALLLLLAALAGAGGYGGYYLYNKINNPPPEPLPVFNPYAPDITIVSIGAEVDWQPASLEELEEDSDLIVRGYILGNRQERIEYQADGKTPRTGFTTSTLVVRECYKGTLLPGDKIPFVERYYTTPGTEGQLITYNHYMPTLPMEDYVFFLSRQPVAAPHFPGRYFLRTLSLGKYKALSEKQLKKDLSTLTPEVLGLSPEMGKDALDRYISLMDAVTEQYIDPPTEEELTERARKEAERAGDGETAADGKKDKKDKKDKSGDDIPFWAIGMGFAGVGALGGGVWLLISRVMSRLRGDDDDGENAGEKGPTAFSMLRQMLPEVGSRGEDKGGRAPKPEGTIELSHPGDSKAASAADTPPAKNTPAKNAPRRVLGMKVPKLGGKGKNKGKNKD